jgi:hypothetical protein
MVIETRGERAVAIRKVMLEFMLHTWNTRVPLKPCPDCGQPYAPEPMLFLRDLVAVSAVLWGICPACRRKRAAAQLDLMWRGGQDDRPAGN